MTPTTSGGRFAPALLLALGLLAAACGGDQPIEPATAVSWRSSG